MSEQESISEEEVGSLEEELGSEEQKEDPNAAIQEAFTEAITEDGDDDDVKLAMIGAGATFKNVTTLYNKFMIDAGLALSKEDKAAHVTTSLEGLEFADEEGFDKAVESLVDAEKGINERSAGALLRAYAKKNELEVFKKPKAEASGKPGFATEFYAWLVENPTVSEEDAKTYIMNPENSPNTHRHLSHYQNIRGLANRVAANYVATEEPSA